MISTGWLWQTLQISEINVDVTILILDVQPDFTCTHEYSAIESDSVTSAKGPNCQNMHERVAFFYIQATAGCNRRCMPL